MEEKEEKPLLELRELKLRPRDHELAAKVVVPDRVAGDIARDPVLALAIKEDLAEALGWLRIRPSSRVRTRAAGWNCQCRPGRCCRARSADGGAGSRRAMRTVDPLLNPVFRAPGWIIHPATLDALANTLIPGPPPSAPVVDMVIALLRSDGADTGQLLGYPFVVSAAAFDGTDRRLYFSADWREAWIGVDGALVEIAISTEAHFQADETVIRATMSHDFVLRRKDAFTWAKHPDPDPDPANASPGRSSTRSRATSGARRTKSRG